MEVMGNIVDKTLTWMVSQMQNYRATIAHVSRWEEYRASIDTSNQAFITRAKVI